MIVACWSRVAKSKFYILHPCPILGLQYTTQGAQLLMFRTATKCMFSCTCIWIISVLLRSPLELQTPCLMSNTGVELLSQTPCLTILVCNYCYDCLVSMLLPQKFLLVAPIVDHILQMYTDSMISYPAVQVRLTCCMLFDSNTIC